MCQDSGKVKYPFSLILAFPTFLVQGLHAILILIEFYSTRHEWLHNCAPGIGRKEQEINSGQLSITVCEIWREGEREGRDTLMLHVFYFRRYILFFPFEKISY